MIRVLTYLIFSVFMTTHVQDQSDIQSIEISNEISTENEIDTSFINTLKRDYQSINAIFQPEKVYVQIDKTQYEPGETIWFTAFVRDANTNLPTKTSQILRVELSSPSGAILKEMKLNVINGMANGDFLLDENLNGGRYRLRAYTNWQYNLVDLKKKEKGGFEKEILIQKSVLPNLRMKLDFKKESYAANDEVVADLTLKTLNNSELRYYDFEYVASLNGEKWIKKTGKTDFFGKAQISFNLPKALETNDGLLNVMINYNGLTESISRAIPITLNDIDLQFLPEGGHIISQEKNNIAFKALDEFGEPADIEGIVLDATGKEVAKLSTYHQGMGVFQIEALTSQYRVKITKPKGITKDYSLNVPQKTVTLGLQVTDQTKEFIKVKVFNHSNQQAALIAHGKGKIFDTQIVDGAAKSKELTISTKEMPSGMITLTLFDGQKEPVSERLVFVNHHQRLNISIQTNKQKYKPREKVKMDIFVRDHLGNPVSGQFGLSVVDDKLLSFADDKQANILGYMLLQSELKGEVKEPNFYFENPKDHPDKDQLLALDLLMMTQGWRKYEWIDRIKKDLKPKIEAEKRYISGKVVKYGNRGIEGVVVKIPSQNLETKTDKNGDFRLDNVFIGEESIIIELKDKDAKTNLLTCNDYGFYEIQYEYEPDVYASDNFTGRNYPRSYHRNRKSNNIGSATVGITNNATGNDKAMIKGIMIDQETEDALIAATVSIREANIGAMCDIEGSFLINNIDPGTYTVAFTYTGYSSIQKEITLKAGQRADVEVALSTGVELHDIVVVAYARQVESNNTVSSINVNNNDFNDVIPVQNNQLPTLLTPTDNNRISQDQTTTGKTITAEDIKNLPIRNIAGIVARTAGVTSADENNAINFRGSRSSATIVYVDGIRVNGSTVPVAETNRVDVTHGGMSAAYNLDDFSSAELINRPEPNVLPKNRSSQRFRRLQQRRFYSGQPLFFLDGRRIPIDVAPQIFSLVDPDAVSNLVFLSSRSSVERYGDAGQDGAYIIKTYRGNLFKGKQYKKNIKKWIGDSQNRFNEKLAEFREKNKEVEQIINGINKPTYSTTEHLKDVENDYQELMKLKKDLKKLGRFVRKKVKLGEDIPNLYNAEKYFYALNFKKGLYQPREYYVPKYTSKKIIEKSQRNDFRSTIYWNPTVQLNENGKASVEFYMNDAITTFRATLEGISTTGQIGRQEATFYSEMPFGMITKVPSIVLTGDDIQIPLTLMNNTKKAITGNLIVEMPKGFVPISTMDERITLGAGEKKTIFLHYKVTELVQTAVIRIQFQANGISDEFEQPISIMQRGFPVREMLGGSPNDSTVEVTIHEPLDTFVDGKLTIYPTQVGEIIEMSKRMIRQPYGCFSQTSSSNYPNVMVLQYLREMKQLDVATNQKLNRFLDVGYKRLTGFEVKGGGFDWYGRGPANEHLTAYGLMQFKEMAKVYPVSEKMMNRTANWLLSRKDGKGSWKRSNYYRSATNAQDAYIVWSLTNAGYGAQIKQEIDKSYQDAVDSQDPYLMAMLSDVLFQTKDPRATPLFEDLLKLQTAKTYWAGKKSAYHSYGSNLYKETTALTVLAWMSGIKYAGLTTSYQFFKGLEYLSTSKSYYGYGSTQSTVLILKALIEYQQLYPSLPQNNEYFVFINNKKIIQGKFNDDASKAIVIEGLGRHLTKGKNELKVTFSNQEHSVPFDFALNYTTNLPMNKKECDVQVATSLSENRLNVGNTVRLTTKLTNVRDELIFNPIAIIGIPSGLSLQPWQLKKLKEKEAFDYYELMDGYVVFHYIDMKANEEKVIHLDLKADIPGKYEAPASTSYLYYSNDVQHWEAGEIVDVLQ